MRIQHNIMAMNSYRNLGVNNNALSKNLEKLSSGYSINRAGDNAAGLAISEKMRMQITGLDVAQDNAQSGINLIQTAEGALTEVHDMLNRMFELAEQSANSTLADEDRDEIQKEVEQLKAEIDRISDATDFNGTKLLNGSLDGTGNVDPNITNLTFQIGDTADSFNQLTITVASCGTASLGDAAGDGNTSISTITLSTLTGAQAALSVIKQAIKDVSGIRGGLGAAQNRLEHTINNLAVTQENIQEAESTIRDTDVAEEMMAYTKNNILIQSAQAMLAQSNQVPQGVLQLLQ